MYRLKGEEPGDGIGKPLKILLLSLDCALGCCQLDQIPNFCLAAEGQENSFFLFDFIVGDEDLNPFKQIFCVDAFALCFELVIIGIFILSGWGGTY